MLNVKRSRWMAAAVAAFAVAACQDVLIPPSQETPADQPTVSASYALASRVLDAAWSQLPVERTPELTVGVLDAGLTENAATVVYITRGERLVYPFTAAGGDWRRGALARRESRATSDAGPRVQAAGYPNTIAKIYRDDLSVHGVLYQTVTRPDITASGTYSHEVVKDSLYRGEFFTGSATVDNIQYSVDALVGWYLTRGNGTVDTVSCTQCLFRQSGAYPTKVALKYHMQVVLPVGVTFTDGPSYIPLQGTYLWTAMPSGGDAEAGYVWKWEISKDSATWTTAPGGSRFFSYTLNTTNHGSFWIRATVTSGNRVGTAIKKVTVANPLYVQLDVGITGPHFITFPGSQTWDYFEWTATPSGGAGPYTYQWEMGYLISGTWQFAPVSFQTTNTLTHGVDAGDGDVIVRARVTSADGQTATHDLFVEVYGGGGGCGPLLEC